MNIKFIYRFKQRYIDEKDELLTIDEKTIEKGSLVLTNELKTEEEISKYTGAKYAIGLNSGTDALMMAQGSGIKGDEVLTSPISLLLRLVQLFMLEQSQYL